MPDIAAYLSLLPPATRARPKAEALFRACLKQVMDLFSLLENIPVSCSLSAAAGPQLDAWGALVGEKRPPGEPDETFRLRVRCRAAKNRWPGTNDTLPAALAAAFPGREAFLADNGDGTVTASLSGPAPSVPLSELFPIPAGIRLTEEEGNPE